MPSRFLALSVALLACSLGCSNSSSEGAAPLASRSDPLVDAKLLNAEGTQRVIVNLRVGDGALDARPARIAAAQQTLLDKRIAGFTLGRRYRHVPAIAGIATAQAIEQLGRDPGVFYVQYDEPGAGQLKEAVPAIGGDQARMQFGVTGRGVRVALLDTGVDTDHPDLKDALVAQHCFTQFACPPFGNEGTSAEDDNGHGSNVAGIIASRGMVSSRGFAPAAELVAIKINDANDSGVQSDWVAGLDWLFDNLAMLKVKLVNLSIGTTTMYRAGDPAECDRGQPALAAAIKNLVDAGVTVFAATGNRGSTTSMPAPACNTGVIAVGAVYDSSVGRQPPATVGATYAARWGAAFAACSDANAVFDQITCFTNSTPRLDLLAPGAPILSDSLRGRTEMYWGTSQASPAAVGVAALLLECDPTLTPAQVKQILTSTGVPRTDMRNGVIAPSVRALEAVKAVCEAPGSMGDAGVVTPDAGQTDAGTLDAGPGARPDASVVAEAGGPAAAPDSSSPWSGPGPATGGPTQTGTDGVVVGKPDAAVGSGTGANSDTDCDCATAGASRSRGAGAWLLALGLALTLARRRSRRST